MLFLMLYIFIIFGVSGFLVLGSIHNLPRGGGAMIILRGVTLFPYYDLGGAVENFQRK